MPALKSPSQLELFPVPQLSQRGTYRQSLYELADWALEHGAGRLTRNERGFLFGIVTRQWTISVDDAAKGHRLYRRVGKQQR